MERFAGVTAEDQNAGYLDQDESDLEYSECEDSTGSSVEQEENTRQAKSLTGSSAGEASSEDEFEKQMATELDGMLHAVQSKYSTSHPDEEGKPSSPGAMETETPGKGGCSKDAKVAEKQLEYYDGVYFASSSSGESDIDDQDIGYQFDVAADDKRGVANQGSVATEKMSIASKGGRLDQVLEGSRSRQAKSNPAQLQKKHRKLTNDELLYDPDMDDKDERWVRRQRMAYHNVKASEDLLKGSTGSREDKPAGDSDDDELLKDTAGHKGNPPHLRSDAVLNCPACMATLCLDCQRHEVYKTQYRAMFVMNCSIMKDEVLRHKPKQTKLKKKRPKSRNEDEDADASEVFNPVRCTSCNTEVAVYDKEGIFHFYNVLAGN